MKSALFTWCNFLFRLPIESKWIPFFDHRPWNSNLHETGPFESKLSEKKTRIFLKKKSSSLKEKKTSRNGSFFLFFLLLLFLLLLLLFLCFYFSETGQDSSTQSLKNRQPTRPPPFPQMTWRTRERAGGKPGRSFKYSVVKLIKNGQKKKHWNWEPSPIRTSALRTLCKNHVFFKNIFEADPFLLERPQTNSETQ